jgi:[citrate (pro-3S)-lyase] ligase
MREACFFQDLGFYEIANVDGMITFLENRKNGFPNYLNSLKRESHDVESLGKQVGAVVMNANPFTMGHLFLVEEAAKKCEILHVFVVSEDCSMFPFSVRQDLVKKGTAHLKNVICHASGPYIISQGTFPSYFLKEEAVVCEAHAKLDIAIFEIIARELGITNRFVGEEKKSMVTSMYNRVMLEQLNKVGIKAEEIPRKKINEEVISASKVRQWIHDGQLESVCPFVPKTTWEYLYSEEARPVLEAIQKAQDVIHY